MSQPSSDHTPTPKATPTPAPTAASPVDPNRYVPPANRMEVWSGTVVRWLTARGISLMGSRVLVVRGRKSGDLRRTPVNLMELDGERYLVAPRGNTEWVRNVRAAGGAELHRASGWRRSSWSRCPSTSGCRCCGSTSPSGAGRSAGSSRACRRSRATPRSRRSPPGCRSSGSPPPPDRGARPGRVPERLPGRPPGHRTRGRCG